MLSAAILIPFFAGLVILTLREERSAPSLKSRNGLFAVVASAASLVSALLILRRFAGNYGEAQLRETWFVLPGAGINAVFAVDGVSMPLFITTAFLFFIAALFSLSNFAKKAPAVSPRLFWGMLLLLESTILGVFSAYNLILFYIFWELFLIPISILIWRFGLEERRRATLLFFLYTFISSVFMIAAFAAIVYYVPRIGGDFDFRANFAGEINALTSDKQRLVFLFLVIAFLVKTPVLPLHAWLPWTHTQAPAGTLLLSGLMLKMGSYGILRFITPNFSGVLADWGAVFAYLGIASMFYGSFAAYRQKSFRHVIAYSSLAHMGLLFSAAVTRNEYALSGAIIQNVGHSLANALLFVVVAMHLVRGKSDALDSMSAPKSLVYWFAFSVAIFSAIGVPGTIGFTGEFMMLYGLSFSSWLLVLLASMTLVWSAVYMLRLFHKVRKQAADVTWRPDTIERTCLLVLSAAILWFGLFPVQLGEHAYATAKSITAAGATIPPQQAVHK